MAAEQAKPPVWFWVVSAVGFVWNAIGVVAFVNQMTTDLTTLPDAQRLFFETTPAWAIAGFAVAVFGGTLGCLALLLRKSWAVTMLIICVVGIVIQITHSLVVSNGLEAFGPQGLILPAMTFGISVILVLFAAHARKRGWLN